MHPTVEWLCANVPPLMGFLLLCAWGLPTTVLAGRSGPSRGPEDEGDEPRPSRPPDVTYEPTEQHEVDKMLEVAQITKGDVLYDLGCGDGRIPITAAQRYGIEAVGIDIDPDRILESRENARRAGVAELVTIRQDDLFTVDLSPATVIALYLTGPLTTMLAPRLAQLRPGTRIVSHLHEIDGAKPKKMVLIEDRPGVDHDIYLYVVPWETE